MPVKHQCTRGHTWEVPNGAVEAACPACPICSTDTEHPVLRLEPGTPVPPRRQQTSASRTVSLHSAGTVALGPTSSAEPTFGDRRTIAIPLPVDAGAEGELVDRPTIILPIPTNPEARSIPGYVLERELGRGGMGVVYQARAADGQLVALKMILAGFGATEADRSRFLREARASAALRHPNIVRVLEVGEANGQPFFCLEFVGGGTLAERLAGRAQAPREAARLVAVLARAMQTAHDAGIVHCDLKPANVLLEAGTRERDGEPRDEFSDVVPKITDFGLALNLENDDQSRCGWIVGTPCYMAPEQAAGRVRDLGTTTDIWALGAILYECLTGRPPFQGRTALETLNRVQEGAVVSPRQINPAVPRELETICLKCLQKNPSRRYHSMAELARDLERFQQGQRVHALPPGVIDRLGMWAAKHPALFVFLLAGSCALLTIAMLLWSHNLALQAGYESITAANRQLQEERDQTRRKQIELEEREALLQEYRYAAHIEQAQQLWNAGDLLAFRDILAPYLTGAAQQYRDFACRYLARLPEGAIATLAEHHGDVYSLAWSPDGSQLVSGGKDGLLRIWDMPVGTLRHTRVAHREEVNAVAFAPSGRMVATGSDDGRIGLWNALTGDLEGYLPTRGTPVISLAFAANARTIYAGLGNGELVCWSLGQLVEAKIVAKLPARIDHLTRSREGRWLAVAAESAGVYLFDLTGEVPPRSWPTRGAKALAVAFAPSGQTLTFGRSDGLIGRIDLATGKEPRPLSGHTERVHGLDYLPNESLLISSGQDGSIGLWNGASMKRVGSLYGHTDRVWCVAVSPDGQYLASAGLDGTIRLWKPALLPGYEVSRSGPPYRSLVVMPGSSVVALGTASDVEFTPLEGHRDSAVRTVSLGSGAQALALSPDRRLLVVAAGTDEVVLCDLVSGTNRALITSGRSKVGVAFSPDGHYLAASDTTGKLYVWMLPELRLVTESVLLSDTAITDLAFQPGTNRLAVGFVNGRVGIWEADAQTARVIWIAHQTDIERLAFSADGKRLVTAGRDRAVRLWDPNNGRELRRGLLGHTKPVLDVAFSPDGRVVASGGLDGCVRVWSIETGLQLLCLDQSGPVRGLGFLDEDRLIVVGHDVREREGYLRVYSAAPKGSPDAETP